MKFAQNETYLKVIGFPVMTLVFFKCFVIVWVSLLLYNLHLGSPYIGQHIDFSLKYWSLQDTIYAFQ